MLLFIKGIIIGVAAIIPGVSGSVFAVITGVYDDIISKIARIGKNTKDSARFLIPLAAGIGAGVLLSANPILEICNAYPVYSYSFFIGCIQHVFKQFK